MKRLYFIVVLAMAFCAAGCASGPQEYKGLESASRLQPSADFPHTLIYKRPGVDGKKYIKFIIDPVEVYKGEDARFDGVSPEDQQKIADFVKTEFTRVMQDGYAVVNAPGPDVLRLKFTLAGLEKTNPAMATVTHVIPIGLVMNLGKSAAGMSGSFMGSVTLAGELYDSQTNTLVFSFLTKKAPNAMDITTVLTGLDAAKKSVTELAEKFKENIDKIQKGTK
ncbi:MAG: DUF3313 domain-containing protein [Syntrophorhabdaceae bacterium]|nr:DUF3313 domain-containing protein [Syntrophorhabdaceae bacterium]